MLFLPRKPRKGNLLLMLLALFLLLLPLHLVVGVDVGIVSLEVIVLVVVDVSDTVKDDRVASLQTRLLNILPGKRKK